MNPHPTFQPGLLRGKVVRSRHRAGGFRRYFVDCQDIAGDDVLSACVGVEKLPVVEDWLAGGG